MSDAPWLKLKLKFHSVRVRVLTQLKAETLKALAAAAGAVPRAVPGFVREPDAEGGSSRWTCGPEDTGPVMR
jgi:hypothetical protein